MSQVAVGDVNRDGEPDLCVFGGAAYVLVNRGGGVRFKRGDANADGGVNLADAVFVLG